MWCPPKNLGPIGSAVLTFIGYKQTNKQTNKQTDRQAKFIYKWEFKINSTKVIRIDRKIKQINTFYKKLRTEYLKKGTEI